MSELDPKALSVAAKAGHHAQFEDKEQAEREWATWQDAQPYAIKIAGTIVTAYLSTVSPLSDGDGRIKALKAELLAAREALRPFAETPYATVDLDGDDPNNVFVCAGISISDLRRARALTGNRSGE